MIFQDPLSSLNPIVKIGQQITEAMLLKNKTSRKESRKDFNKLLALLQKQMELATGDAAKAKEMCKTFDNFCVNANKLEHSYNLAQTNAEDLLSSMEDFLFKASKNQKQNIKASVNDFSRRFSAIKEAYFTASYGEKMTQVSKQVAENLKTYTPVKNDFTLPEGLDKALRQMADLLKHMLEQDRPDFFRIGFYLLKNPNENLAGQDMAKVNEMTLKYLNDNFMIEFIELQKKGVEYSYRKHLEKKQALLDELKKAREYFSTDFDKKAGLKYVAKLTKQVEASIDRLEISKDSAAYTFGSSMTSGIEKLFYYKKKNPQEEARFARQSKRREALIARGKKVDWKVVPKVVLDLDELRGYIVKSVDQLIASYTAYAAAPVDFEARSIQIIDYLKDKAAAMVFKLTKAMAREKAIKLMEEVGIHEPRRRFYQYPFEFSGGMRQRIVIAIALSANPDILICDEPTTALDVTIQAQILELINRLKRERNLSIIFITHDLGVVANMADRICVMYAGRIIEVGTADDIFYSPAHPYTWALLSSMPDLDTKERLFSIPGAPPNMLNPPKGDAFAARNRYAMELDFEEEPPYFRISDTHYAATWLLHPDAPKVEMPEILRNRIERMKEADKKYGDL